MISEPEKISANSIADAWRESTQLLIDHGDRFNLIVHVTDPTHIPDEKQLARFDPKRLGVVKKGLFDVANTIFPKPKNGSTFSPNDFFSHYKKTYKRGKSRTPTAWGTYFQRLSEFGPSGPSQIEKIIECMNTWQSKPRAAFVMHLSGAHLDNPRSLGAPCWQYGQFIRTDTNTLSLSVVYRSHDYFEKALGNFLGLSRLLSFVCKHTHQIPGSLTCLSTYAHLGGKKTQATELLRVSK
ncbi:MAG: hypothetical protein KF771_01025 [Burkholderiales bacterium]|nr:hypothetical protein [Burkholderiales bacterium]